jgi:hypothetical protein
MWPQHVSKPSAQLPMRNAQQTDCRVADGCIAGCQVVLRLPGTDVTKHAQRPYYVGRVGAEVTLLSSHESLAQTNGRLKWI